MDFKEFSEKLLALEAPNTYIHTALQKYLQNLGSDFVYKDAEAALDALEGHSWAWHDGSVWGAAVVILWVDQEEEEPLSVTSLVENTNAHMGYEDFLDGLSLSLSEAYVVDGKAWDRESIKKLIAQKESPTRRVEQQQTYDDRVVSPSVEWKPWIL